MADGPRDNCTYHELFMMIDSNYDDCTWRSGVSDSWTFVQVSVDVPVSGQHKFLYISASCFRVPFIN